MAAAWHPAHPLQQSSNNAAISTTADVQMTYAGGTAAYETRRRKIFRCYLGWKMWANVLIANGGVKSGASNVYGAAAKKLAYGK